MALDPERRRELAERIKVNAPDAWWAGGERDLYEELVDDLLRLGWTAPPSDRSARREEVCG